MMMMMMTCLEAVEQSRNLFQSQLVAAYLVMMMMMISLVVRRVPGKDYLIKDIVIFAMHLT
jgi:hypothetical protein